MQHTPSTPIHARSIARRARWSRRDVGIGIVTVALILIAIGSYLYTTRSPRDTTGMQGLSVAPMASTTSTGSGDDVLVRAARLMLLPNEQPVIYSVDNAHELAAQQQFFIGSQNGDVLFVFPKSEKAVIYSPARNIIVNVGPITYEDTPASAMSSSTPASEIATSTTGQ